MLPIFYSNLLRADQSTQDLLFHLINFIHHELKYKLLLESNSLILQKDQFYSLIHLSLEIKFSLMVLEIKHGHYHQWIQRIPWTLKFILTISVVSLYPSLMLELPALMLVLIFMSEPYFQFVFQVFVIASSQSLVQKTLTLILLS